MDSELLPRQVRPPGFPRYIAAYKHGGDAHAIAAFKNRSQRLRALRRNYRGGARLDYAGFVCGYLADGVAENLGVVHADGGYDAHLGINHVGGVEASS